VTLADLTVDIVAIIGAIAGKRRNRAAICSSKAPTCEPSSTSLLVSSAAMNLSCVGVHPDMELSPAPTHLVGVLLDHHSPGPQSLSPVLSTSK